MCVYDSWKAMLIVAVSMVIVDTTPLFVHETSEKKNSTGNQHSFGFSKVAAFQCEHKQFFVYFKVLSESVVQSNQNTNF